jgi:DmsE family decaheme c-type cytochrome
MLSSFHRRMRCYSLLFALCLAAPGVVGAQTASKPANSVYVGPDTCKQCHANIFQSFEHSPHWKITLKSDRAAPWQGCESCHGPGREHADSAGDPAKIFAFHSADREEIVRRCLSCHQYGEEHSNFLRSAHKTNDVSCVDCHSAHHFQTAEFILRKPQPQLCYGCHQEIEAEFAQPFRHRVKEGLVLCTDCHNQHGGLSDAQLRATSAQDAICLNCHSDKGGPFVFEHVPQRTEGCASCHLPHGSSNPRMLKRNQVNLLCLECHTVTFGSIVRDAPGFHDQAAHFQACTLCHVAIHGSNFSRMLFK